jgi:hypothetical protein
MPDFINADTVLKTGLIEGLAQQVASLMPASWNHVAGWLKEIEALQQAA